ncbi:hypothetical protein BCR35DRAFT_23400 [Leucosporidium creatinivorum]|uniref:Uncharacterized protein n=1 Tax=Leucosporidium creatinivorum TaxID=106004 RepID=A0A1Y2FW63_9BASI|nr:hypothetical protein BCR35DRAFT_23400 [Leucosporidium creatinivorum]
MASIQTASAATSDLAPVASALAMPMVKPAEPPAPLTAFGLPTPSSLPTANVVPRLEDDPTLESLSAEAGTGSQNDDRLERSASESAGEEELSGARGEVDVFAFEAGDVEMAEGPGAGGAAGGLQSNNGLNRSLVTSPAPPLLASREAAPTVFSSNITVQRPFRSRYHDVETPLPAPLLQTSLAPSSSLAPSGSGPSSASSVKRSFDEVTPSSGTTPPAVSNLALDEALSATYSPFPRGRETSTSPRPTPYRHSFDSQRASVTSRMRYLREHDAATSTLRRRSPMSSRAASRERSAGPAEEVAGSSSRLATVDRSKRRRSSTLPETDDSPDHESFPELDVDMHEASSSSSRLPTTFAPALGRYPSRPFPIDPVLTSTSQGRNAVATGSPEDDLVPIRRGRLSLPGISRTPPNSSQSTQLDSPTSPSSPRSPRATEEGWLSSLRTTQAEGSTNSRRSGSSFPTFSTFRRATSTSYQLAAPVTFPAPPAASASTSSYSASPPSGSTLLRPRSARARPDPMRERQLDPMVSFWREEREQARLNAEVDERGRAVLQQAGERLERAEESMRGVERANEGGQATPFEDGSESAVERATRMLQDFPAVPASPPADVDDSLPALQLPSTQHLPPPDRTRARPPIIGVRVGEGWGPSTSTSSPRTGRRASDSAATPVSPTSPSASSSSSDVSTSGTSGSRALHFLTSLRSRRPRLSRNATGVPPPESPEILMGAAATEREEGWIAAERSSGETARAREEDRRIEARVERDAWRQGLAAMRSQNRSAESADPNSVAGMAAARSSRIPWAEARRETVAESSSSSSSLWGAVGDPAPSPSTSTSAPRQVDPTPTPSFNSTSRRMRGPTERANERWRLGQQPISASSTTATTSASSSIDIPRLRPPWRDSSPPSTAAASLATPAETPAAGPSRWVRRTEPTSEGSETIARGETSPFTRADSPSPRRAPRWSMPSSIFTATDFDDRIPTLARDDTDDIFRNLEEGISPRPSIRIPRPRPQGPFSERARAADTPYPRNPFNFEEEDEELLAQEEADEVAAAAVGRGRTWARPYMLPSGSVGRRAGEGAELVGEQEEREGRTRLAFGGDAWGWQRREPLLFHPSFNFEPRPPTATTTTTTSGATETTDNSNPSTLFTHRRMPIIRDTTSTVDAPSPPRRRSPPARSRSTIAEALSHFGTRSRLTPSSPPPNDDSTLRRRRGMSDSGPSGGSNEADPSTSGTSATERHTARAERLASIRRERNVMRALFSGAPGEQAGAEAVEEQPRSPGGTRRRVGLGDFFTRMGGVGNRFIAAWDDDFAGFYRRDSAALDARNYVVSLSLLVSR